MIETATVFDINANRLQCTFDPIVAALRELETCPFLPLGNAPFDLLRAFAEPEDFAPQAMMNAQPWVERQTIRLAGQSGIVGQ